MATQEQVMEALGSVSYPGFNKDIVTVGVVEAVDANPDSITISLKAISADDEALSRLAEEIRSSVAGVAGSAEVHVVMAQSPQAAPHGHDHGHDHGHNHSHGGQPGQEPSPFQRKKLKGVKHIVAVTSGKGGVGKSTVAVNLAYTLSKLGNVVGILDLDIFGPSVHKMLGINERLAIVDDMIAPGEKQGLKVISIGMAVEDAEAMILRGPMVMKVIDQLINQVNWGGLDYLIVDLPPGTGDVPLSLVQQLEVAGAVIVTTPQDVALIDVRRSIAMYRQTETHILGLIENMSYYKCEKCGDVAHIFGHGGGAREAADQGAPLLGSIPLTKTICEEAEKGSPIFDREKNPEIANVFEELAQNVMTSVRNAPEPKQPEPPAFTIPAGGG